MPVGGAFDQSPRAKSRFNCFLKAAEAGDSFAQQAVAEMYTVEHGVPSNKLEAQKWARKAAEQGNPDIQYVFAEGLYGAISPEESAHWFKMSAEKGFSLAQQQIAIAYLHGVGVQKSKINWLAWAMVYKIRTGDDIGLYVDEIRNLMTDAEVSEAQNVSEHLLKTIEVNMKESCKKFGNKYDEYGVHCFNK